MNLQRIAPKEPIEVGRRKNDAVPMNLMRGNFCHGNGMNGNQPKRMERTFPYWDRSRAQSARDNDCVEYDPIIIIMHVHVLSHHKIYIRELYPATGIRHLSSSFRTAAYVAIAAAHCICYWLHFGACLIESTQRFAFSVVNTYLLMQRLHWHWRARVCRISIWSAPTTEQQRVYARVDRLSKYSL